MAWVGRHVFTLPDVVMLYLLGIMVVAARFERGPSALAAALCVLAYNFFFVPPVFGFNVEEPHQFLTFAVMFAVGLSISGLTSRIRRQERETRESEGRTRALYALTQELADPTEASRVAEVVVSHIARAFETRAALLRPEAGHVTVLARSGDVPIDAEERAAATAAYEQGNRTGEGTATHGRSRTTCFPIHVGGAVFGVLALEGVHAKLRAHDEVFLASLIKQSTLALARATLAEDVREATLRAQAEAVRSSLLSAVSHDLRTPLAVITGAATSLRDTKPRVSETERDDLVVTICEEADRLERLVANLLDVTRLESGALELSREWTSLDELLSAALRRLDHRLGEREIAVDFESGPDLVLVDPILLEQVFVNLLDNTLKYTAPASPIEVRASVRDGMNQIEFMDRGPGLEPGMEERVFEKFVRAVRHGDPKGAGLGLAICRGIVQAHAGKLTAENRSGGGAIFRVLLPTDTPAVEATAESGTLGQRT